VLLHTGFNNNLKIVAMSLSVTKKGYVPRQNSKNRNLLSNTQKNRAKREISMSLHELENADQYQDEPKGVPCFGEVMAGKRSEFETMTCTGPGCKVDAVLLDHGEVKTVPQECPRYGRLHRNE
jgi:hypothetical protein